MSEYVPTTWVVRERFLTGRRKQDVRDTMFLTPEEIYGEFDRWLAQHDQEVVRAARVELVEAISLAIENAEDWYNAVIDDRGNVGVPNSLLRKIIEREK